MGISAPTAPPRRSREVAAKLAADRRRGVVLVPRGLGIEFIPPDPVEHAAHLAQIEAAREANRRGFRCTCCVIAAVVLVVAFRLLVG
jgi:hypothetical protein